MDKQAMNIYLYHPSRGRPEQAERIGDHWSVQMRSDKVRIYRILSIDSNDSADYDDVSAAQVLMHGNRTMVEALNRCLLPEHEGIIVTLYDDMIPSEGWDEALLRAYKPGKLFRVDCGVPLQTVCAGCASVFQRWGYVYYPGYVSMFADNDYQEHGEKEGLFIDCEMSVWHNHPAHGTADMDATYERQNHSSAYKIGEKILTRRRWSEFTF